MICTFQVGVIVYNFNFGFGAPVYAGPGLASKENAFCRKFMIFLDTPRGCEGEGGVDVWLALESIGRK